MPENEQMSWIQDRDNLIRVNITLTDGKVVSLHFPDEEMAKEYADQNAAREMVLKKSRSIIMDCKPGDKITITVDGRPYETYIDESGVQRFPIDITQPLWDRWSGYPIEQPGRGTEDLNQLCIAYQRGEFDQRTYAEFNMSLGYSVCGFVELSSFHDLRLVNPLWDETEDDEPNDDYLYANMRKRNITVDEVLKIIQKRDDVHPQEADLHFVTQFMLLEEHQYGKFSVIGELMRYIKDEKCTYDEAQLKFLDNMKWI